jgi:membrane protease YdiL (CAAX protease family)
VSVALVLVALGRAVLNGVAEELGWRAVYVGLFPDRPILGRLAPAVAFALWHLVPLSIVPSSAGDAFLAGSLLIGLGYGWVAWRTGSIRWTTPFYILTDASGLGAAAFVLGLGCDARRTPVGPAATRRRGGHASLAGTRGGAYGRAGRVGRPEADGR